MKDTNVTQDDSVMIDDVDDNVKEESKESTSSKEEEDDEETYVFVSISRHCSRNHTHTHTLNYYQSIDC